jgi:hypothetical protein
MINIGPRKKRNALSSYMGQCDAPWSNMAQKADSAIWCEEPGNKSCLKQDSSKCFSIYLSIGVRNIMNILLVLNSKIMKEPRFFANILKQDNSLNTTSCWCFLLRQHNESSTYKS